MADTLEMFPLADFMSTKGAVKLHVGLNHSGYLPEFISISEVKSHYVTIGRLLQFPKESIIAMDKGFNDYSRYKQLSDKVVFFVTRLKTNTKYCVIAYRVVPKNKGVLSDQSIEFTGAIAAKKCPAPMRLISYIDPETGKHYRFLTNSFALVANTIADFYKSRWKIELFSKWIKQNLKIKSFFGTSKNAVMNQIWIAMYYI